MSNFFQHRFGLSRQKGRNAFGDTDTVDATTSGKDDGSVVTAVTIDTSFSWESNTSSNEASSSSPLSLSLQPKPTPSLTQKNVLEHTRRLHPPNNHGTKTPTRRILKTVKSREATGGSSGSAPVDVDAFIHAPVDVDAFIKAPVDVDDFIPQELARKLSQEQTSSRHNSRGTSRLPPNDNHHHGIPLLTATIRSGATTAPVSVDILVQEEKDPTAAVECGESWASLRLSQAELEQAYEASRRATCPTHEELAQRYAKPATTKINNRMPWEEGDIAWTSKRPPEDPQVDIPPQANAARGPCLVHPTNPIAPSNPSTNATTATIINEKTTVAQLQRLQALEPILTHLAQQVDPHREFVQVTHIPKQYQHDRGSGAMEYYMSFQNAMYASVTVMQLQAQGLAIPSHNTAADILLGEVISNAPVIRDVLPFVGAAIVALLHQRKAVSMIHASRHFLAALPATDGPGLDRFITKLSAEMVCLQMERPVHPRIDHVMTSLEEQATTTTGGSASTRNVGATATTTRTNLFRRGQEWSRRLARRMGLLEDLPLEGNPAMATGILHASIVASMLVENHEKIRAQYSTADNALMSPEASAEFTLSMMNLFPVFPPSSQSMAARHGVTATKPVRSNNNNKQILPATFSGNESIGPKEERPATEATIQYSVTPQTAQPDENDHSNVMKRIQELEQEVGLLKREKKATSKQLQDAENRLSVMQSRTRMHAQSQVLTAGFGVESLNGPNKQQTAEEVAQDFMDLKNDIGEQRCQISQLTWEIATLGEKLERALIQGNSSLEEKSSSSGMRKRQSKWPKNRYLSQNGGNAKDSFDFLAEF